MLHERKNHVSQPSYRRQSIYLGGSKPLLSPKGGWAIWGAPEELLPWPGQLTVHPSSGPTQRQHTARVKLTTLGAFRTWESADITKQGFFAPVNGLVNTYLHCTGRQAERTLSFQSHWDQRALGGPGEGLGRG